jgi:hypothetical protein
MSAIPVDGLHHVTVVVNNARATAKKFSTMYGIDLWEVTAYDPSRLGDATTHGFRAEQSYLSATGTVSTDSGPLTFVLVEPRAGWTTYHEFLNTRGEGIHSICTAVVERDAIGGIRADLEERGVPVGQSATRDRAVDSVLFDTRAKLGGFYIEVLATAAPLRELDLHTDESWDFRADRAGRAPLMLLGGIKHFGVVVPDLMAAVNGYSELFGIATFSFRNWRTAPGSLDEPTYLGKPVDHAYFTTMVTPIESVAFEVIQPTLGPSHYKEDYMQRIGPGIHHIHGGNLDDAAAWQNLRTRMAEHDVPVVMSGGILDNYVDFYYLDTRAALAGYVTEFVVPGKNHDRGRPSVPFAMTVDLSAPVQPYAGAHR